MFSDFSLKALISSWNSVPWKHQCRGFRVGTPYPNCCRRCWWIMLMSPPSFLNFFWDVVESWCLFQNFRPQDYFGPKPFQQTGGCTGQIRLNFDPQVLQRGGERFQDSKKYSELSKFQGCFPCQAFGKHQTTIRFCVNWIIHWTLSYAIYPFLVGLFSKRFTQQLSFIIHLIMFP